MRTAGALDGHVKRAVPGDRDPVREVEAADAATMLDLYAAHLRRVNERSARIAWAVEHAARSDAAVSELWARMNENRRFGVKWAVRTLLEKPGAEHVDREDAERIVWVALDWGTFRLLAEQAGMSANEIQAWLASYLRRMLISDPAP